MSKTYLFSMMGHAGSGKSYFAKQLAANKRWVRLNSDSLRMALFGSVEAIQAQPLELRREGVFRVVDYAVEQVLLAGQSVVYDSNNHKIETRSVQAVIAKRCNAKLVAVWVQAPKDVAVQRLQNREVQVDQRQFSEQAALDLVDRHIANTDEPTGDENVIKIDGMASFEQQLQSFESQLAELKL